MKGLTLLEACQKDRSEYVWTLVVEYEDNELLASDKDNVKRIEKAEKVVPAKVLKGWPQKTWEQLSAHEQRKHYSS